MGCTIPCKEQAGNREGKRAVISYSCWLVLAWLRSAKMTVGFVGQNARRAHPHAEEHRSANGSAGASTADARCDASRSMRAMSGRPHPSRRAHAALEFAEISLACALLRMRTTEVAARRRTVFVIPVSRCQTATLVPAAYFAPGFCIVASPTPNRGVGGAPRNVRVFSGTPVGVSCASKTRVNALVTRYARRLARRLASHSASRRA
jgi:hypothetical protein